MRVLISSVGTRGDVQPALALAEDLRKLGQQVRLCVPPNFVDWATGQGFEARPIGVAMRAPRPGEAQPPLPDLIRDQFDVIETAAQGCDVIVGAGVHQYAIRSVAELVGAHCVVAAYSPTSLPGADKMRWAQTQEGWNDRALDRLNSNRQRLGLASIDDVLGHILGNEVWLAADPVLGPAHAPPGLKVVQTGAWLLADPGALPNDLERFLGEGEPPVYLGFGSMPADPAMAGALIEGVRAAGRRLVLSRGWAGLELTGAAADAIAIDDVSHERLFPRMGAVVHHGGAGTTTAAALAGAPQVISPMFGDQPYWASRVEDLGVGVSLPRPELSAQRLAEALVKALHPKVAAQAGSLAPKVSTQGAAQAARRLVERCSEGG